MALSFRERDSTRMSSDVSEGRNGIHCPLRFVHSVVLRSNGDHLLDLHLITNQCTPFF